MEETPHGGAVKCHVSDRDIPVVAAVLATAVNAHRVEFLTEYARLPNEDELRSIQDGVLNDWYRMIDRLQQHRRAD